MSGRRKEIRKLLRDNGISLSHYYINRWVLYNIKDDEILELCKRLDKIPERSRVGASLELYIIRFGKELGSIKFKDRNERVIKGLLKTYKNKRDNNDIITPRMKEHWINKGYSEKDAIAKVREISKGTGKKAIATRIKNGNAGPETFNTNIEFYTSRGMSLRKAKETLTERQSTFTLEKCIKRYGEIKGTEIFKKRQEKWIKTLDSKSDEEKFDINRRKFNSLPYSKESVTFFINLIKDLNLKPEFCFYAENERFIRYENSVKFYDFSYLTNNKKFVIEYHGIAWHPKPEQFDWKSPIHQSYEEIRNNDIFKESLAIDNDFVYYSIYSDYSSEEYNKLCEDIIEYLNN